VFAKQNAARVSCDAIGFIGAIAALLAALGNLGTTSAPWWKPQALSFCSPSSIGSVRRLVVVGGAVLARPAGAAQVARATDQGHVGEGQREVAHQAFASSNHGQRSRRASGTETPTEEEMQ